MNTKTWLALMSAVAFGWIAASCGNSNAGSSGKEGSEKRENAVTVRTELIRLQDFAETIRLTGTVLSENDVVVPAEESGRVVAWTVEKGAAVTRGQTLARLDDEMVKAAFDAAEAAYKMAEVNYEKQKKAYDEQAISELQLKNLEFQRDAAKAQMNMAQKRLNNTQIVSPVNGLLNDRFVDVGEMIGAGMPAAHVVDTRNLKIAVGIPERFSKDVRIGMKVEFTIDAFSGETFSGTVTFVSPAVVADNRTIPAEIKFQNANGRIKPNMIARTTLMLSSGVKAIAIPEDYIQQVDIGRTVVYVANNGRAVERTVRTGGTDGRHVRILEGLSEGDELIIAGQQTLVDQQLIVIQN